MKFFMVRDTVKNGQSWCLAFTCRKRSAFDMQFHVMVVSIFLKTCVKDHGHVTFCQKGHKLYCPGDIILVMKIKAIAARPMVLCDLFSMHWYWLWLVYKVFLPIMCESHASGLKTTISRINDNFSCQTHQFERIFFRTIQFPWKCSKKCLILTLPHKNYHNAQKWSSFK